RVWKTGLPVRSAVLKPHAGRLVVGWVTTSESLLLYVFAFLLSKLFIKTLSEIFNNKYSLFLVLICCKKSTRGSSDEQVESFA
ncbi:hypothetical protein BO95DRAFT_362010, partial [Aspergillus brunneoviolaceus CBS 621.78]